MPNRIFYKALCAEEAQLLVRLEAIGTLKECYEKWQSDIVRPSGLLLAIEKADTITADEIRKAVTATDRVMLSLAVIKIGTIKEISEKFKELYPDYPHYDIQSTVANILVRLYRFNRVYRETKNGKRNHRYVHPNVANANKLGHYFTKDHPVVNT